MATLLEGFFDDATPDFKLWQKTIPDISKETRLLSEPLYKLSKKSNSWKLRLFELTPRYLIYYKSESDKEARGVIDLSWVRTNFIKSEKADDKYKFGIRFVKNGKYSDLWAQDQES